MADIGAPTMPDCIKDRTKQYFSCMISVLEEMSYASTRYFISSNNYTRKNCVLGSWVKGFKVKADQNKSSNYLKSTRSLVLTNSWPREAGDMILGLGGLVGIWAAQALPLGAAFPPLHPCWKAGHLAMFSRELEVWVFIYNLLILMLATNFFPQKQWNNLHSDVLESAFSLCRFLFLT